MASITANKKDIVDFLWEWAESNGTWGKLLVNKVISQESDLLSAERELIFNYFLQSLKLYSDLPELSSNKPIYTPTDKRIELVSLSDINGVNKLAKKQTLNFSKNITVIYGENGTGKTGYSRILKNLGFSYDQNNIILSDIYNITEPKAAIIKFNANEQLKTFNWNGTNKDPELLNISVFNNNCVQLSLSDRQLIVTPIGFHLFNLITNELNELAQYVDLEIKNLPITLNLSDSLSIETPQQIFISGLTGDSSVQKLAELSNYNDEHEKEQAKCQEELGLLNKPLLENQIQNLTLSENELKIIITKIKEAQTLLNNSNWQTLNNYNKDIKILESKTQTGIKDLANKNGVEFYETKEFQTFIKSAEDYIKILNKPDYPKSDDLCIYCKQPLKYSATELLKSYRGLLNDKTQDNLKQLIIKKTALINLIKSVDTYIVFNQTTFGINEDHNPTQPNEIILYNKLLSEFKNTFISDKVVDGSIFIFEYEDYIKFFTDVQSIVNQSIKEKGILLGDLTSKETALKNKIAELKDRKLLSQNITEIEKSISNRRIISILRSKSSSFNSGSISRKTSEARAQLVEQNFNKLFSEELLAFRKSDIKIELNFGTDKGKSKITHRMKSTYALTDILSEGEQKAIALAEFLTELQLDNIKSPVIFDDPVNSLDHRIIDEVGKRLIELSKSRQVIIFTHSILFLHSLIQQSELESNKQENVLFEFCKVKNNFGVTGILDEVEEINSFSYYTKKLKNVLAMKPSPEIDESKIVAEGYGHLRSAIEVSVEDDLLKKTIKRYKKGVAFPSLLRIEGNKIDSYKGELNSIYEKCCVSIYGHSSPSEVHTTPTIEELKIDFANFMKVRSVFTS